MITQLIWTIWSLLSAVPRKAIEFNHSLTHWLLYFPLNEVEGVNWFHFVVCPPVHLWTELCPLCIFTILTGSISYSHTLSSNFRRCVTCKVFFFFQNWKLWSFDKLLKFITFTLSCYDLGSNMNCSIVSRVTLYTAGHLHIAVPHCSHSRAPIVHTAMPRENNEQGCVYLCCKAVCKLPGCVEGHLWVWAWDPIWTAQ